MVLHAGIIRVLKSDGTTAGTGFIVTNTLVATCAHVIEKVSKGPGEKVKILFHITGEEQVAIVEKDWWRASTAEDIAILRLEQSIPDKANPLYLGSSKEVLGHNIISYGFPQVGPYNEFPAFGLIIGEMPHPKGGKMLAFRSQEISPGMSGAPVWDTVTGRVVGMVNSFPVWKDEERYDKRKIAGDKFGHHQETNFATSSETLRAICSALKFEESCPYIGLAPFSEEQAHIFFGRKKLIDIFLNRLRAGCRFLAVVGPSGSGKSSVIQAGLFPALRQGYIRGSRDWLLLSFRPGKDPFSALATLGIDHSTENNLSNTVRAFLNSHPTVKQLVLYIDQFEELFALCPEPVRDQFLHEWLALLESELPVTLILTLQAGHFYGQALAHPKLGEAVNDSLVNVLPMNQDDYREVVTRPAIEAGLHFEEGLVETIVEDVDKASHPLPLLQVALRQLWIEAHDNDTLPDLTNEAYRSQVGRVAGAIGQVAGQTYSSLDQPERTLVQQIFTRLVHYGESDASGDTLQRQLLPALIGEAQNHAVVQKLVQKLANARLLVIGWDALANAQTIEIIHSALLVEWERLKKWSNEQREFYLWRQRLNERLQEWNDSGQHDNLLLRDPLLTEAKRWKETHQTNLNKEEHRFVQASIASWEQAKTNRRRRRNLILSGAIIVAIVTSFLAWFGQEQAKTATAALSESNKQRQFNLSRQLAAQAINLADSQYDLALLLSLQAYHTIPSPETQASLLNVLEYNPRLTSVLYSSDYGAQDIAFSPDGEILAATTCLERKEVVGAFSCASSQISLWDMVTGQLIVQSLPHEGYSGRPIFSPDGQTLALIQVTGEKGKIVLWNINKQQIANTFDYNAASIAFSPDGQTLALGDYDHKIILLDATTGQPIGPPLIGHTGDVLSVAFSPDGEMLASGGTDDVVILWDLETRQPIAPLLGHASDIWRVVFDSSGTRLVSTSHPDSQGVFDGKIIIWDVLTHKPVYTLEIGLTTADIALGLDGKALAVGSGDNIMFWNTANQQQLGKPLYNTGIPWSLSFNSNGQTLASSSMDGKIALWNVIRETRFGQTLYNSHSQWVKSVDFSPDGQILASGGYDKTIVLWDSTAEQPIGSLEGHTAAVHTVAFHPNGQMLASGSDDNTIILWDLATGQPLGEPLTGHTNFVRSIAFSSDGKILASGSHDNTIILWDITRQPAIPIGEPLTVDEYSFVDKIAFSPDGKHLAMMGVGQNSTFVLWDIITRQYQNFFSAAAGSPGIFSIAYAPDGLIIATGGMDGTLTLWDTESGTVSGQNHIQGNSPIAQIAFNPDGTMIATGTCINGLDLQDMTNCVDGEIDLWDVATLQPMGNLSLNLTGIVSGLDFAPDGQTLASGDSSGKVVLWDVNVASWQTRVCHIVNRNLSMAEWEQYIGSNTPYERTCPELPSGKDAPSDAPVASNLIENIESPPSSKPIIQPVESSTESSSLLLTPTAVVAKQPVWHTEVAQLPDGVELAFSAVIQCREEADSDLLTQQFLGIWGIQGDKKKAWVSNGEAAIVLESNSRVTIQQYDATFNLTSNDIGWLMSNQSKDGYVMSGNELDEVVLKLFVNELEWQPFGEDANDYDYTLELKRHDLFGIPEYPQHVATFQISNLGNLLMENVYIIGVVQNQQGDTIDILFQDNGTDIAPNETAWFTAKSRSSSGRCVGPVDQEGYVLHYWLNFVSKNGEPITRYYTSEVD